MKLITLNAWGGRLNGKFKEFFDAHPGVDAWLFQEVYNSREEAEFVAVGGFEKPDFALHETLAGLLGSHKGHFCQVFKGIYGLSAFLDPKIEVVSSGEMLVAKGDWHGGDYDGKSDHHRKLQWFEVRVEGKPLLLMNVHLTHRPEGKLDSPKRLMQSDVIVRFMGMFDCPKVLVGDFNLLPDTQSIKAIEAAGLRNLVKEYGVTSTRTEIYKKQHRFADYIFVSPEVRVKEFKVLPDVVSDHSPLYLDFEV